MLSGREQTEVSYFVLPAQHSAWLILGLYMFFKSAIFSLIIGQSYKVWADIFQTFAVQVMEISRLES